MYTTKVESSEKGWFKKSEILYYKLYKDGKYICTGNTKDIIDKIMLKHQDYEKEPKFKVFKLGSGEFQIFQKVEFNYYASDWYNPVYINSGEYLVASEIIYYKTLSEACKALLEYERLEARKIKEPVDCI